MEISNENRQRLNLFTVQEVADLLKMNVQVIARKLKAGEIRGYKLGKDWRVSEQTILEYLESHSNQRSRQDKVWSGIETYFEDGRLTVIPSKRSKRLEVLKYLVSKLEDRVYTEKEINEFLRRYHPDVCTLRREFIMNRLMVRKDGRYKVVTWSLESP
jgi:excisionase family DNA binding protein